MTNIDDWILRKVENDFTFIDKQFCPFAEKPSRNNTFFYLENKSRNKMLGVSKNILGLTDLDSHPEYRRYLDRDEPK